MDKQQLNYVELLRVITATNLDIPPDDIDMSSILNCVARGIEEKVKGGESDEELMLCPRNNRELKAIVGEVGEKVLSLILERKYPFDNFIDRYAEWYKENLAMQFLKKQ